MKTPGTINPDVFQYRDVESVEDELHPAKMHLGESA